MNETVISTSEPPCAACPWRVSNLGKSAPKLEGERFGWYSPANLRRLWRGLQQGDRMTCHLTDTRQPQRNGKTLPEGTQTRECAGALILCQRELDTLQRIGNLPGYRRARPFGLSKAAVRMWFERLLIPIQPVGLPNLAEPDIQHAPLGRWEVRKNP